MLQEANVGLRFVPAAFGAVALGALALAAVPASASDVTITGAGIYDFAYTIVTGDINQSGSGAGIIRLTGFDSTGAVDFDAFCVDLAHQLYAGKNVQKPVNYHYNYATLTEDGFGNLLSATQISQMKGLAALGFSLVGDPSKVHDLAAIQVAIWTIEYPNSSFTTATPAVNALVSTYLAMAPYTVGNVRYLQSVDASVRQGVLIPGVPEPATWALLIAGFGMVGVSVRRRQRNRVLA